MPTASPKKNKILRKESLSYDTAFDGEASVLELWGMWSISSLSLFQGPIRTGVVVSVRIPSMGQIELFNHLTVCIQMTDVELNC